MGDVQEDLVGKKTRRRRKILKLKLMNDAEVGVVNEVGVADEVGVAVEEEDVISAWVWYTYLILPQVLPAKQIWINGRLKLCKPALRMTSKVDILKDWPLLSYMEFPPLSTIYKKGFVHLGKKVCMFMLTTTETFIIMVNGNRIFKKLSSINVKSCVKFTQLLDIFSYYSWMLLLELNSEYANTVERGHHSSKLLL